MSITAVAGIKVGHWTNRAARTGCTVVLCEAGAVAGADARGGAPGTRETVLLAPGHLVRQVHGILLTGGSAFGLEAAGGVMRYLEERGIGFDAGVARVPIVPAAVLFDLQVGDAQVRPDAESGYQACLAATVDSVQEGSVGAGCGATVGKLLGPDRGSAGGVGSASRSIRVPISEQNTMTVTVGALVAVNSYGNVIHPETGRTVAGVEIHSGYWQAGFAGGNTTLVVIATDAALSKEGINKVAQMAHDGLARCISPVHTPWDGDLVFGLSTGTRAAVSGVNPTLEARLVGHIGAAAAWLTTEAVLRAVGQQASWKGM